MVALQTRLGNIFVISITLLTMTLLAGCIQGTSPPTPMAPPRLSSVILEALANTRNPAEDGTLLEYMGSDSLKTPLPLADSKKIDATGARPFIKKKRLSLSGLHHPSLVKLFHASLRGRILPPYPPLTVASKSPVEPDLSQVTSQIEFVDTFRDHARDLPKPDTTFLTYGNQHGYQVEYFGTKGDIYLWYPGNRGVLSGQWKIRGNGRFLCHRYNTLALNPVTNLRENDWGCRPRQNFEVAATIAGDVFGLSARRRVPHILYRCKVPKVFVGHVRLLRKWGSDILEC